MIRAKEKIKKKTRLIIRKIELKTGDKNIFGANMAFKLANKRIKVLKSALEKVKLLDQADFL